VPFPKPRALPKKIRVCFWVRNLFMTKHCISGSPARFFFFFYLKRMLKDGYQLVLGFTFTISLNHIYRLTRTYNHLSQLLWLPCSQKASTFWNHVRQSLTMSPLSSKRFHLSVSSIEDIKATDDSLGERKSAPRMRKVYRKLVRGKSNTPIYFRGGKNVGTVRRR